MNPYSPPATEVRAVPPLIGSGTLWQVIDGSLWVRNGASLPDLCVHGSSSDERVRRSKLVLRWSSTAAKAISAAIHLGAMLVLAWKTATETRSLLAFFAITMAAAGGSKSLGGFLGMNEKVEIHCASGPRRWVKFWIYVLVCFGLMTGGIAGIRAASVLGLTEDQEMGAFFTLIIASSWAADFIRGLIYPRVAEKKDGWFRLKNFSPVAMERLEQSQQRSAINPGSRD